MQTFELDGRRIAIYRAQMQGSPVVYLNVYQQDEADEVFDALQRTGAPDLTLVVASGFDWNADMTPWPTAPVARHMAPCEGKASECLTWMLEKLVAAVEAQTGAARWRALAGYSLAGLFALYAATRTDAFSRIGSMSASLWYPDFAEYFAGHALSPAVESVYFSLGDAEHKTRNAVLQTVRSRTETIEAEVARRGVTTTFVLERGNHFSDVAARTAAGIAWLAAHPDKDQV